MPLGIVAVWVYVSHAIAGVARLVREVEPHVPVDTGDQTAGLDLAHPCHLS
jgi:hypothetical protein